MNLLQSNRRHFITFTFAITVILLLLPTRAAAQDALCVQSSIISLQADLGDVAFDQRRLARRAARLAKRGGAPIALANRLLRRANKYAGENLNVASSLPAIVQTDCINAQGCTPIALGASDVIELYNAEGIPANIYFKNIYKVSSATYQLLNKAAQLGTPERVIRKLRNRTFDLSLQAAILAQAVPEEHMACPS